MNVYKRLLNELDGLLGDLGVLKADDMDDMVGSIRDLLFGHLDAIQKQTIEDAIRVLSKPRAEKLSEDDFFKIKQSVEESLGIGVDDALKENVLKSVDEVYARGQEVVLGFRPSFQTIDTKAVSWLQKDCVYWIGNHYETDVRDRLLSAAEEIVSSGVSRSDAAKMLEESFGDQFTRSQVYWDGLANHVVTRGREFGSVSGYDAGGIKKYQILAHIDQRTSDICRQMNGRIIEVAKAVELRDSLMAAEKPEDVKDIAPWVKSKSVKGKKTKDLPVGLSLPPYHFKCRTTTIAVDDDAEEDLQTEEGTTEE